MNSCPAWNLPCDPTVTPLPKAEAEPPVPQIALLALCGSTLMVTKQLLVLSPHLRVPTLLEIWKSAIPSLFKSRFVTDDIGAIGIHVGVYTTVASACGEQVSIPSPAAVAATA
jgi:hypothetical protein